MEIFSGDFKDIFYDEEAEKRKEKRKERRDELQKAKIPDDYSPNQREMNWFLVCNIPYVLKVLILSSCDDFSVLFLDK